MAERGTPVRGVRVDGVTRQFPARDALWERAQARAESEGVSVSEVLRTALREYADGGDRVEAAARAAVELVRGEIAAVVREELMAVLETLDDE